MKRFAIAITLAVALGTVAFASSALARNPHCAGGIQYVVQGLADKDKGNLDDYKRQMLKAVQQLEQCSTEDSLDYEAMGYLGWAYAEVDSTRLAGEAFRRSIAGLSTRDKKKADLVTNNRDSYWAGAFNRGISRINEAQAAYPSFDKVAENDADKALKEEARKKYTEAAASLIHASEIKPGDPRTLRNLGSVYAFMGDWEQAQKYFEMGLARAPGDSDLIKSLLSVSQQRAGSLIDQGKYDEAITYYGTLLKTDPTNSDAHLGIAEAYFKKAKAKEGDAAKADYKSAADAYAKAAEYKPGNPDLFFNAALAYQNAGDISRAEAMWRAALKARPQDTETLAALASTLSDEKKYEEAISMLQQAVVNDPKNKVLHRQLGAIYSKAGNTAKGTEEYMVFVALNTGKPVADPAAQAKKARAGSAAAKMLASLSAPEQVSEWEMDGQKYETWFYWTKKQALHFNTAGVQVQKSDWSVAAAVPKK